MNNPTKHKINSIVLNYEHYGRMYYDNCILCNKALEDEFGESVATCLEYIGQDGCYVYYCYSIAWIEDNKPKVFSITVE